MKAKKSTSLYFRFLNNIKIPGLIYTALVTLTTAIYNMELVKRYSHSSITVRFNISNTYGFLISTVFIASALIVFYAFSFLRSKRATDFYMSLPIKRTEMYFTVLAAAFTWVGIAIVLSVVVGTVACLPIINLLSVNVIEIFLKFGFVVVVALLGGGISALSCSMTGTAGTTVLSFISLTYLPAIFPRSVLREATNIARGNDFNNSIYSWLVDHYLVDFYFSASLSSPFSLIFTLLIAILFIALGCIFFNKRQTEIAGNGIPNKLFHLLNRGSIVLMIMWTMVDFEDLFDFPTLQIIAITYVLYMAYELVITKRLKNVIPATIYFIPTMMAGFLPRLLGYLLTIL